jgi:transcriptional regulator with XRE-family HTH domain
MASRTNNEPRRLSDEVLQRAREEIGHRLRELREQRSWSQGEASRQSGVSQGEWSRIESAETNPGMTTLLRIQHALNLDSVETLFGEPPSRRIIQAQSDAASRSTSISS